MEVVRLFILNATITTFLRFLLSKKNKSPEIKTQQHTDEKKKKIQSATTTPINTQLTRVISIKAICVGTTFLFFIFSHSHTNDVYRLDFH